MSRITPISKPTKSPASQKKSFLLSNLFCGCWNQIAKSSPGQEETTSGLHDYTHRENLWPRQELSFTSGKPLSAAAEDQVRLTSVPQTPDTPPRCPSQQSLARFSQLIPAGPPVHLFPACSYEFSEIKAWGLFAQHSAEHLKFSAWEGGWSKVKALYCWEAWTQQDTIKVLPDQPPSSLCAAGSCEVRDPTSHPKSNTRIWWEVSQESPRGSLRVDLGNILIASWKLGGFGHHPKGEPSN